MIIIGALPYLENAVSRRVSFHALKVDPFTVIKAVVPGLDHNGLAIGGAFNVLYLDPRACSAYMGRAPAVFSREGKLTGIAIHSTSCSPLALVTPPTPSIQIQ